MNKSGISWGKWFFIIAIILVVYGVVSNNSDNQQTPDNKITGQAVIENLNSLGSGEDSNELETESKQQEIETEQEQSEEETFNEPEEVPADDAVEELEDEETKETEQEQSEKEISDEPEEPQEFQEKQELCTISKVEEIKSLRVGELVQKVTEHAIKEGRQKEVQFSGYNIPNGDSDGFVYEFDFVIENEYFYIRVSDYEKDKIIDNVEFSTALADIDLTEKSELNDITYRMIHFVVGRDFNIIKSKKFWDENADGTIEMYQSFDCYGLGNCDYDHHIVNENLVDKRPDSIMDTKINSNFKNIAIKIVAYVNSCEEQIYSIVSPEPQEKDEQEIVVLEVIDGDTIKLNTGEKVRLIGINAPETGQPCSSEAKSKLTNLVFGRTVTLEKDVDEVDQYGRLLRYVYVDGTFVNVEVVRLGFAHKYEYGSNTQYSSQFEQAEQEAQQNQGCLWQSSEENYIQDQCIYIYSFHYNAAGDDNYNLNDEYVIFGNKCSYSVDMSSWTVKDETASHLYTFPSFTFQPGAFVTLSTGLGTDTNSVLYWGRSSGNYAAIWNNGGDTLYIRDNSGNLVLVQSY